MSKSKDLGTAYSVSKRKKYAKGGQVPPSAKSEKQPSADEQSAEQLSRNRGSKPPRNDEWTSNITIKQAQKPSITKLSQPRMVGSDVFSVRNRDMHEDEAHMMDRMPPETDRAQPPKRYDEHDAKKQGSDPDMHNTHSTSRKPYNKAIEDQYAQDMAAAEMKKVQSYAEGGKVSDTKTSTGGAKTGGAKTSTTGNKTKTGGSNPGGASTGGAGTVTITTRDLGSKGINVSNVGGKTAAKNHGGMDPGDEDDDGQTMLAKGGRVEDSDYNHTIQGGRYQDDLLDLPPSSDMGASNARSHNEEDQIGHGPNPDMERQHNNGRMAYANGGDIHGDEEMEMEHHASIAAAIMARRDRLHAEIESGSHDLDSAVMMAEGGEVGDINGRDSIYSDDSDQADLSRNAEEDANMEDQLSFDALRKENYSESEGLAQLDSPDDSGQHGDEREDARSDKHDMVDKIRRGIKAKRRS